MNVIKQRCKTLSCAIGCYCKKLAGVAMFVSGILMLATLWLMPFGLLLAFVGTAFIDPDHPCI